MQSLLAMPTFKQFLEYILEPYNLCYTVGNLLCFLSFAVKDMLRLRLLYIAGGLFTLPYFLGDRSASPTWLDGRWLGVFWVTVYTLINAVGAVTLILERRPVFLSKEQKNLHREVFHALTPRDMLRLVDVGEWRNGVVDDLVITAGSGGERLILLYAGRAAVKVAGKRVATLQPGQFVGEMSFVSGALPSADVCLDMKSRYIVWDFAALRALEKDRPELYQAIFAILSVDLARKLAKKRPDTLRQTLSLTMTEAQLPLSLSIGPSLSERSASNPEPTESPKS